MCLSQETRPPKPPNAPAVPHHQSELLDAALKRAGVPVTFYTVKGAGHGGFKDPKAPELTRQFFARHLNPQF